MRTYRFLASILLIYSCSSGEQSIRPEAGPVTESVYASGVLKCQNQHQVFPAVTGIIESVHHREGDSIRKGDVLFTLVSESGRIGLANAELSAGYAEYSNNRYKLAELRSSLVLAQQKATQDSVLYERQKRLWKQNIGTALEFEQRELALAASRSNVESIRVKLQELDRQLKFQSGQSRNNLALSSTQLEDFQVRSLHNGNILNILREAGESASPQTPLATIGDADKIYIELQVDEYDIARIKSGMEVFVRLDSHKDTVFKAKVSRLHPIMNERSKTFTVEAEFITKPAVLYPNMNLEASIVLKHKDKALTIPRSYLGPDNTVRMRSGVRKVKTGLMDFKNVEILEGLDESDEILLPAS